MAVVGRSGFCVTRIVCTYSSSATDSPWNTYPFLCIHGYKPSITGRQHYRNIMTILMNPPVYKTNMVSANVSQLQKNETDRLECTHRDL